MKAADPSTATRPPRQRADYWMECGAAEALLRLLASQRLLLRVTFAEAAKIVGVSEQAARDALHRPQAVTQPAFRGRNATHPAPAGTKWCGYGQHFPPSAEFARVHS